MAVTRRFRRRGPTRRSAASPIRVASGHSGCRAVGLRSLYAAQHGEEQAGRGLPRVIARAEPARQSGEALMVYRRAHRVVDWGRNEQAPVSGGSR